MHEPKGRDVNAAYGVRRDLSMATLMSHSVRNLALIWRQVLVYLAVFALLGLSMPLFGSQSTGMVGFLLYFAGQYWLFRALLKSRGLLQTTRIRFFAFIGLAIALILPIIFGLAVLIVPGLFLVSRWIAAPAFIVAQGQGVFAATESSASAVRGNTARVAGAAVVLFLIGVAISGVLEVIGRALGWADGIGALDLVEGHLLPLALLGLSTATYELLGPEDSDIEEIFG